MVFYKVCNLGLKMLISSWAIRELNHFFLFFISVCISSQCRWYYIPSPKPQIVLFWSHFYMTVLHRICGDIEIRTEENAYKYIPLTRLQQNAEPYYKTEKKYCCQNHMWFWPKSHVIYTKSHVIVITDDNN